VRGFKKAVFAHSDAIVFQEMQPFDSSRLGSPDVLESDLAYVPETFLFVFAVAAEHQIPIGFQGGGR